MVRSLIVIISLISFSFQAKSQVYKKYSELGLYGGVSYYLGDLNPAKQFFMVRPGVGLVYRFNPSRRFTWQFHGIYSSVQAYDSLANNDFQVTRNLSFRSRIIEVAGSLQFNFFDYEIGNDEEAENIKKAYEETTGVKYNKNKIQDIIHIIYSSILSMLCQWCCR
jgi:hypothetical protein